MHMILGYKHVTDHVITQALGRHMIPHMILGMTHLTSQGIGQPHDHMPSHNLDMQHIR